MLCADSLMLKMQWMSRIALLRAKDNSPPPQAGKAEDAASYEITLGDSAGVGLPYSPVYNDLQPGITPEDSLAAPGRRDG